MDEEEDVMEDDDNGWKIIHTDVFRFPPYKSLFCAILGKKMPGCMRNKEAPPPPVLFWARISSKLWPTEIPLHLPSLFFFFSSRYPSKSY